MSKIFHQQWFMIGFFLLLSACQFAKTDQPDISVSISADDSTQQVFILKGSTVQSALETASLTLGQLDQIDPPMDTVLTDGMEIIITRVWEEYETQQEEIPFERQELPNESMPAGDSRLIQAGQNGKSEIHIRRVFENGIETSSSIVSEIIILSPLPEILMVGVQNPYTTISIPGKLAYLTSGNAWMMEESTANRWPLVTSGDLDGRVFSLSPDGCWLLYSRKSNRPADQEINSLWVVNVTGQTPLPINLHVTNIVHFADWQPGKNYVIAYSTVEPRTTAPGWQANNDLYLLPFNAEKGEAGLPEKVLDTSSGGIYGWWGTSFSWSPDGTQLAYSQPDGIGLVGIENKTFYKLMDIVPLNTYSDWAWIPSLAWGSDSKLLFFITHAPPTGLASPEESPYFDLAAISLVTGISSTLFPHVGMFSYPIVSPLHIEGTESGYEIACLQAIFPSQSATSRYQLMVLDRDGSDSHIVFPEDGQGGIEPQITSWSPEEGSELIAVLKNGNLWIVDTANDQEQQVTSDGLTSQLDWK